LLRNIKELYQAAPSTPDIRPSVERREHFVEI
jgi:hypothetical protein